MIPKQKPKGGGKAPHYDVPIPQISSKDISFPESSLPVCRPCSIGSSTKLNLPNPFSRSFTSFQKNKIFSKIFSDLGDIKSSQGDLETAKEFYSKAKEFDPLNKDALEGMSTLWYISNDYDPKNEMVYLNRALSYHENDVLDAASEMYKATLLCNPFNRTACFNLGQIYSELGKEEDADRCSQQIRLIDSFSLLNV